MNMESDDIAVERPVLATVVVAAVATVAYVGVQLVSDGGVAPAETASFVLIFTLVYVAGARYLRERTADADGADDASGDNAASGDATE
ncbi:hypothetical protein [Halosimplex marinum]|uniref:hypothetical protein n=1 Tax=Halosimplex marinum TaxID=3396620 RepID=UPI003F5533FE